jgi:hypothetical protein
MIETQSYALVLRDALFNATLRLPLFASGWQTRKTRRLPIQKDQAPVLGVYLIDETMTPDGDGNAGEIAFVHTARIGFSAIVIIDDPAAAEAMLDRCFWALMNGLWRDPYLTNLIDTLKPGVGETPDNVRFESIARGVRRHSFGLIGSANETPFAELQYDVSFVFRTEFAPTIEDDLEEIVVTTAFPPDATDAEREGIQQVRSVVRFPQPKEGSS